MTDEKEKSLVTVEPSGARSIDVAAFLRSPKGQEVLDSIKKISETIQDLAGNCTNLLEAVGYSEDIGTVYVIRFVTESGVIFYHHHITFSKGNAILYAEELRKTVKNKAVKKIELVPARLVVESDAEITEVKNDVTC